MPTGTPRNYEEKMCEVCSNIIVPLQSSRGNLHWGQFDKKKTCSEVCRVYRMFVNKVIANKPVYNSKGYNYSYAPWHPRVGTNNYIFEHVLVMERKLNRYLLPKEEVHHLNGDRRDNRPENLELWIVSQPPGQRAKDLIGWAKEILERYEDE